MKKIFLLFGLFLFTGSIIAQSPDKKKPVKDKFVKSWHIDEQFAIADTVPIDTARLNFQENNIIERFSTDNSYNANYGSPIQSKIYMRRPQGTDFMFEDAYKPYLLDLSSALFYDANFPYTNLTYLTGGPVIGKEEQVKFLYTGSPSKKSQFRTEPRLPQFKRKICQSGCSAVYRRYFRPVFGQTLFGLRVGCRQQSFQS